MPGALPRRMRAWPSADARARRRRWRPACGWRRSRRRATRRRRTACLRASWRCTKAARCWRARCTRSTRRCARWRARTPAQGPRLTPATRAPRRRTSSAARRARRRCARCGRCCATRARCSARASGRARAWARGPAAPSAARTRWPTRRRQSWAPPRSWRRPLPRCDAPRRPPPARSRVLRTGCSAPDPDAAAAPARPATPACLALPGGLCVFVDRALPQLQAPAVSRARRAAEAPGGPGACLLARLPLLPAGVCFPPVHTVSTCCVYRSYQDTAASTPRLTRHCAAAGAAAAGDAGGHLRLRRGAGGRRPGRAAAGRGGLARGRAAADVLRGRSQRQPPRLARRRARRAAAQRAGAPHRLQRCDRPKLYAALPQSACWMR